MLITYYLFRQSQVQWQRALCTLSLVLVSSLATASTFTDHPDYPAFVSRALLEVDAATNKTNKQLTTEQLTSLRVQRTASINAVMQDAQYLDRVLRIMSRPGEHKEWFEYYPGLINSRSIAKGVQFAHRYQGALAQAEQEYGVSQAVILGILGVETGFGANKGGFRLVDSLATLAFYDKSRRDYFGGELIALLSVAAQDGIDPLTQVGSYAGAMGYPQFMPSNIRKYGVDYDHDGRVDLSDSPIDAIGSVANYLAKNGWQRDGAIGVPALFIPSATDVDGSDDTRIIAKDLTKPVTVAWLQANGLMTTADVAPQTLANGIKLMDKNGVKYWMTFNNFQVITTYNRSRLYATAVWKLGEEIQHAR